MDPPPTNLAALQSLKRTISIKPHNEILASLLTSTPLPKLQLPQFCLFRKAILVTIHHTWFAQPPHPLTDIGIATYDHQHVTKNDQNASPGPHAENFLNHIWFLHIRLRETAHLPANPESSSSDANNNNNQHPPFHFGNTVYSTKLQAQTLLHQIFHQYDESAPPSFPLETKRRPHRPVIFLYWGRNAALAHVKENLGFDPTSQYTTIACLDAQSIAQQTRITGRRDPSLGYVLAQFCIEAGDYEDEAEEEEEKREGAGKERQNSNTGNFAALTTLVSFLCALRKQLYADELTNKKARPGQYGASSEKSAVQVVKALVERPTPAPEPFGLTAWCAWCGGLGHEDVGEVCPWEGESCMRCERSGVAWRWRNKGTHREGACVYK